MHLLEAFLTAHDATAEPRYLEEVRSAASISHFARCFNSD